MRGFGDSAMWRGYHAISLTSESMKPVLIEEGAGRGTHGPFLVTNGLRVHDRSKSRCEKGPECVEVL